MLKSRYILFLDEGVGDIIEVMKMLPWRNIIGKEDTSAVYVVF
jgi:hypothetical protein